MKISKSEEVAFRNSSKERTLVVPKHRHAERNLCVESVNCLLAASLERMLFKSKVTRFI